MVRDRKLVVALIATLVFWGSAFAQTLYKYRGDDGEWIYADRPPPDGDDVEALSLKPHGGSGSLAVTHSVDGSGIQFVAINRFHAPVEVRLIFEMIAGIDYPHPDDELRWVVPARSELVLLDLSMLGSVDQPSIRYRYVYVPGDPGAQPDGSVTYRLPYAVGTSHSVSQAYPAARTHQTRDSWYAVDFAMPVGTNILAARDGIVFDVAATNYGGGPDEERYANLANLIRVLHDDGTYAVYAHLKRNTIRVSPGDRVAAGEYIADSGNTGFSSGPHLHFSLQRNTGLRVESMPVRFRTAHGSSAQPKTGERLTAYP